ncbi:bifunctional 5,10-methylene-tetrahydrofolate dehydrogenase/ 5,10-methylene-tetrahydrofolate cyclohydrolase [Advenella kashmirensis WT001]|uniref:Bifunctional protein FolD n=1 Tax=Advenella kashmirensis (strain DSM 17095 / LMG 22695 / WT001) TaxID=1036672 RepID=I3UBW1_ADVKW|nr:bifunctional methylenetetrahydrofolate dehydrogenase/methenyltetrahydrofolate cyclohydrolase FolD [Advenella kashmirensis]AFK62499.1 bifunctional 5,10-methylene-tetrahydrofolate dehydrogenase/ 5,10-methylene-tetrahydrofolate cyclohydrolase [Advenella kashmirensis WT001]
MTARIIDGKQLAEKLKLQMVPHLARLKEQSIVPSLTVILVGDDPASQVYVNHKANTFKKLGLISSVETYPAQMTEAELLDRIRTLNNDASVNGILVQLPLPPHFNADTVIEAISPAKDVDGFHVSNAGALMIGKPTFIPCTPYGIMKMLEDEQVTIRGAEAVVVGASNIVGKPMALLLQKAGATVTICNSKTRDLGAQTRRADILVVATGKPEMITGDMIKPGAVVIDVGINRGQDGKLKGDVQFESARQVAAAITPVPGGVGPMTIVMLLLNTVHAAEQQNLKQKA